MLEVRQITNLFFKLLNALTCRLKSVVRRALSHRETILAVNHAGSLVP
jgi:hypothetical protein